MKEKSLPFPPEPLAIEKGIPYARPFSPGSPGAEEIDPGLPPYPVSIQGGVDLQEPVRKPLLLRLLVDQIPGAGAGGIDFASLWSGSPAEPVSQPFRACHGTDEGRLPENAVAAHPAPEEGLFDQPLEEGRGPNEKVVFVVTVRPKRGLAPTWREERHKRVLPASLLESGGE